MYVHGSEKIQAAREDKEDGLAKLDIRLAASVLKRSRKEKRL